jgi:hypothetical protein
MLHGIDFNIPIAGSDDELFWKDGMGFEGTFVLKAWCDHIFVG